MNDHFKGSDGWFDLNGLARSLYRHNKSDICLLGMGLTSIGLGAVLSVNASKSLLRKFRKWKGPSL